MHDYLLLKKSAVRSTFVCLALAIALCAHSTFVRKLPLCTASTNLVTIGWKSGTVALSDIFPPPRSHSILQLYQLKDEDYATYNYLRKLKVRYLSQTE